MGAQIFEAMPFEFYSENGGEFEEYQESTPAFSNFEWEEEFRGRSPSRRAGSSSRTPRGGGPRFKRPVPPDRKRPKKPRHRVPCPPGRRPCPPRGIVGGPYGVVSEPYPLEPTLPTEPEPSGSERIRWVQDCLNQALELRLAVTGVMGPETRSAVRSFQRQQGLRSTGIVGPETEEALKAACGGGQAAPAPEGEDLWGVLAGEQEDRGEEEYRIEAGCSLDITRAGPPGDLSQQHVWDTMHAGAGVYVIKNGTRVVYIGKSDTRNGVRARFGDRRRVFKELDLSLATLAGRTVEIYTVTVKEGSKCTFAWKPSSASAANWRPRELTQDSLVEIAEVALIRRLNPTANDRIRLQRVRVGARANFVITLNGSTIFALPSGSILSAR